MASNARESNYRKGLVIGKTNHVEEDELSAFTEETWRVRKK
ncbi:putative protein [Arabidopsis thaliana]|uniref:At5g14560 n=4 Tax=Arabidopsis TaxID=3701 RepID=Q9LYK3_ARATH|nr:uncharacterized protein AT5G14560 [Arabidopsis thaliana]KAG7602249.1 hypothetical protein ISN45_At05g013350 [Arabidopsis thaliana x Arabidopsis arenosa]KAG7609196.1 hypothetical protein ISN44_As05g013310 [Arabidopsis suecica]AAT41820.1 At5g14560 [Arabidopsis thaliana]AED92048.1 hypothetical protein AT5G14560 [Arabidopsis thaliana]CAA0402589.1 unnamed protein product [Arabidopsis thaliana]|eukprot:NP_196960.1 hypothetical protein AT5G14560 [Arabidopsis thaliana]